MAAGCQLYEYRLDGDPEGARPQPWGPGRRGNSASSSIPAVVSRSAGSSAARRLLPLRGRDTGGRASGLRSGYRHILYDGPAAGVARLETPGRLFGRTEPFPKPSSRIPWRLGGTARRLRKTRGAVLNEHELSPVTQGIEHVVRRRVGRHLPRWAHRRVARGEDPILEPGRGDALRLYGRGGSRRTHSR